MTKILADIIGISNVKKIINFLRINHFFIMIKNSVINKNWGTLTSEDTLKYKKLNVYNNLLCDMSAVGHLGLFFFKRHFLVGRCRWPGT